MAITANQKVLTLDYWKPASHLEVGDIVFNLKGDPVRITLIQQYHSQNCYEVTFSDHLRVSGDEKLRFPYQSRKYRNQAYQYKGRHKFRRPLQHITTDELKARQLTGIPNQQKFSVPTASPLKLPHQDLPVPPFVFGYWFFNHKPHKAMTVFPQYQEYVVDRFKDNGYIPKIGCTFGTGSKAMVCTPPIDRQLAPNIPIRIPNNYLLASAEQRLELLRGILVAKSRQYNKSHNNFRITSMQYAIIRQVQLLAESLGYRTTIETNDYFNNYTCFFRSPDVLVPEQRPPKIRVHPNHRYFAKVEKLPPQMCVYIETEGESNPILVGEGFIACH